MKSLAQASQSIVLIVSIACNCLPCTSLDPVDAWCNESTTAEERWRPSFHFSPRRNWINDPIRPVKVGDVWHLWFQYNPFGAYWGNMTWGHATSPDLLRWTEQEVAIRPSEAYDRLGIFTGSVVAVDKDGDRPGNDHLIAFYTSVAHLPIHWYLPFQLGQETQSRAASYDGGSTWTKNVNNPLIRAPPAELWPGVAPSAPSCVPAAHQFNPLNVTGFRDPSIDFVAESGTWRMLLGSGVVNNSGMVLQFTSEDLLSWKYAGPLLQCGDVPRLGRNWECPNLFTTASDGGGGAAAVASGYILTVGVEPAANRQNHSAMWLTGNMTELKTFVPQNVGFVDQGNLYAVTSFSSSSGRQYVMGWSAEERDLTNASWAGVMGLPRTATVVRQKLSMQPLAIAGQLCTQTSLALPETLGGGAQEAGAPVVIVDALPRGVLHFSADFAPCTPSSNACYLELFVLSSADEYTKLTFSKQDSDTARLQLDKSKSSLLCNNALAQCDTETMDMPFDSRGALNVTIVLDGSVLEIFSGDGTSALTTRAYPTLARSTSVMAFAPQHSEAPKLLQADVCVVDPCARPESQWPTAWIVAFCCGAAVIVAATVAIVVILCRRSEKFSPGSPPSRSRRSTLEQELLSTDNDA